MMMIFLSQIILLKDNKLYKRVLKKDNIQYYLLDKSKTTATTNHHFLIKYYKNIVKIELLLLMPFE
jgi:hypothetical protein